MRYILSPEELRFVDTTRVAHLATADAAGVPHVIPVCFAYLEGVFWIAIDQKPKTTTRLKRIANIEANPSVSIVFDRYDEDWTQLAYLLVHGRANVLDSAPAAAIAALRDRYEQYRSMRLEDRPAIRITPERVVCWGDLA